MKPTKRYEQGRRDRGGVGGVTPPLKTSCRQMKGFVGKQKIIYHKTLSYIRITVGQYWLRIKKNGKNSVNFRKFVVCHEKRDGGGGGEVVKNNFLTPPLFSPPRYGPGYEQ